MCHYSGVFYLFVLGKILAPAWNITEQAGLASQQAYRHPPVLASYLAIFGIAAICYCVHLLARVLEIRTQGLTLSVRTLLTLPSSQPYKALLCILLRGSFPRHQAILCWSFGFLVLRVFPSYYE